MSPHPLGEAWARVVLFYLSQSWSEVQPSSRPLKSAHVLCSWQPPSCGARGRHGTGSLCASTGSCAPPQRTSASLSFRRGAVHLREDQFFAPLIRNPVIYFLA